MNWDPGTYLRFADHRLRPGLELMARIPDIDPRSVLDLGCGTGRLTAMLAERWPGANVVGVDSSRDMLERAATESGPIRWIESDIVDHHPPEPVDVIYSNAALHWVDDHATLFRTLRSWLRPGGVLAVQMPDNWSEPTHTIPAAILDDPIWPETARRALLRDRVARPDDYRTWLQPADVDLWETTYHHRLTGDDPILTWVSGSVLAPVVDALDPEARRRFEDACRSGYRTAYPVAWDGATMLRFRRLFMVARVP